MGGAASVPGIMCEPRVHVFWDLDNVAFPPGLSHVLPRLERLPQEQLGLSADAKYELKVVCNKHTYISLSKSEELAVYRQGVDVITTVNGKEAADRVIERSLDRLREDFIRDRSRGLKYSLALGVISDDLDFVPKFKSVKGDGVATFYIVSKPENLDNPQIAQACNHVLDFSTFCGNGDEPIPDEPIPDEPIIATPPPSPFRDHVQRHSPSPKVSCCVAGCTSKPFVLSEYYEGSPENARCYTCRRR